MEHLLFSSRQDAQRVLYELSDLVKKFNVATMFDLATLVGQPTTYGDEEIGWNLSRIMAFKIEEALEGWYLIIPPPKKIEQVVGNPPPSYVRIFDERSLMWETNPDMNVLMINCQQNYFNHLLNSRGHVFLNEVYDALGLERTKRGQSDGWIIEAPTGGERYIDFEIDVEKLSGLNNIRLTFNAEPNILDKINWVGQEGD